MNVKNQSQTEEVEPLKTISQVIGIKEPEAAPNVSIQQEASTDPYEMWKVEQSPSALYNAVKYYKPTIDSVVASYSGGGNPNIAAKARVVAAKAIQSYDPSYGASLQTYISNQLRQLTRDVRKSNNLLSIPEGVQLDGYTLYKAEMELTDKLGREPTVEELADASKMSVKRITKVRSQLKPIGNDGALEGDSGANIVETASTDFSNDAVDYVYNDSDLLDKKLIEHTLGYGGSKILDNKTIMSKLKLNDVQLSRRKARIGLRLHEIITDLEDIQK